MPVRPDSFSPAKPIAKQVYQSDASHQAANRMAKARQSKRALPTNSATWRKLRAYILARDPLCSECLKQGRITPATEVDHIDGDATNNDTDNLDGKCKPCHSRKTARENGGFGNQSVTG